MAISRQAHYQAQQRQHARLERSTKVIELVQGKRVRQARLGTRKLHYMLREPLQAAGIKIGRDGLFDVLRQAHLLVPPKRAYHKTTDSHHRFRRHPNLLKAGDHQVSAKASEQVSQALKMALKGRQTRHALIHHSDRGIQYCSSYYQEIHRRHGVTCSMTDGYDCYQNALAERINGILKTEFLLQRPANLSQARQMVAQSVEIYNNERPHLSLKMQTPDAVHRASLAGLTGST